MSTYNNSNPPLAELLTSFNATWLGEGDINAGTNLLVAKAIMLSNLSRTGCGIEPPDLNRLKAGCSMLVSGGLSSSFVSETIGEVAIRQNNLNAQIARLFQDKYKEAKKQGQKRFEFPSGPGVNASENALFHLEQEDSLLYSDPLGEWAEVLSYPPNPRIDDLAARPKILVTAKGSRDLDKKLNRLHGNRPLVCLSLKDATEASSYATICDTLLNGPYPAGEFGETFVANLIVTDPGDVLARISSQADEKAAWLGRMIWLVDGTRGPDAVENAPEPGKLHVSDTSGRFGEALTAVLANRLNNHKAGTVVRPFDLAPVQIRWIAYLKKQENRLPGITGTARYLLATLAFGLIELSNAPHCKRLPVTPEGVEALARWVIEHMANARVAMMKTAEREQKRQLAQRVLWKLNAGRFSKRDICRALSITAARCEEVLSILEPAGLIHRVDGDWEQLAKSPILEADIETLFLKA